MLIIAILVAVSAVALLLAPAICLQLFVSKCYNGRNAADPAEVDAAPLSQRWASVMNTEVTPTSRRQPLSA